MFNLDEFKKGVPAVNKYGEKIMFLGEIPLEIKYPIIGYSERGDERSYTKDGIFTDERPTNNNLIDMYREPKKVWLHIYKSGNDNYSAIVHPMDIMPDKSKIVKTIEVEL